MSNKQLSIDIIQSTIANEKHSNPYEEAVNIVNALERAGLLVSEPTPEQVEAAAKAIYEVSPNGCIEWDSAEFDEWMERGKYRAKARAALEAADAIVKRVDETGNERQKCLGCGRYLDECCLTLDERKVRARAKGIEFVNENN